MEPLRSRIPGPALMGVVNVTPDSFSDGGTHETPEDAARTALRLLAEGAAIVDVGGESTRPGASPVPEDEELRRVLPAIERIRALTPAPISVDTMKPEVARQALRAGATFVNDVGGLRDPAMVRVIAEAGADACVMHMRGNPQTMQVAPRYGDVTREVGAYLAERVTAAVEGGIARERLCVDPGIGFGKTDDHNLTLLGALGAIERATGVPVLVGVSRKGLVGRLIGNPARDRIVASVALGLEALDGGAWMLRVHDVGAHVDALRAAAAVAAARPDDDAGAGHRSLAVRVSGIAVFAYHGALDAERELGQRFYLDLSLTPLADAACDTDDLDDAVHYGEVALRARAIAEAGPYALLERLADEIAGTLLSEFPLRSVTVDVRKPSAPVPAVIDAVAVSVTRRVR